MATKKPDINPWERQKGESSQAFEAFSLYLEMGEERSQQAVGKKLSKSRTLISRWSSQWNWVERVRAYTNEMKRLEYEEAQKGIKEMRKRQIQTAMLMQKKALKALDKMKIEDMSPKDIREYIKTATELERINREEVRHTDDKDIIYRMEYEDMDDIEGEIYGTEEDD